MNGDLIKNWSKEHFERTDELKGLLEQLKQMEEVPYSNEKFDQLRNIAQRSKELLEADLKEVREADTNE
jgi:nucleoside 2-deoxyribosyltransferase